MEPIKPVLYLMLAVIVLAVFGIAFKIPGGFVYRHQTFSADRER